MKLTAFFYRIGQEDCPAQYLNYTEIKDPIELERVKSYKNCFVRIILHRGWNKIVGQGLLNSVSINLDNNPIRCEIYEVPFHPTTPKPQTEERVKTANWITRKP